MPVEAITCTWECQMSEMKLRNGGRMLSGGDKSAIWKADLTLRVYEQGRLIILETGLHGRGDKCSREKLPEAAWESLVG